MKSLLIADTTREEREKIVAESIGNIDGACDGCSPGLIEMYRDYIEGRKELRQVNMEFVRAIPPARRARTGRVAITHREVFRQEAVITASGSGKPFQATA